MDNNINICLISMPSIIINYPSMALGLIKGILNRDGFKSRVIYASFLNTEELLVYLNKRIDGNINEFLLEELPSDHAFFKNRRQYLFDFIKNLQLNYLGDCLFSSFIFPCSYEENIDWYIENIMKHKVFKFKPEKLQDIFSDFYKITERFISELTEEILKDNPVIAGCSCINSQYIPSIAILKIIKEKRPEVITIIGGSQFDYASGIVTHKSFPWIDYIVTGEADDLISPFFTSLITKNTEEVKFHPSIITPGHRKNGYPEREYIHITPEDSFKKLPPPDYDDYFDLYKRLNYMKDVTYLYLPFESTRGCWWGQKKSCTFCSVIGVKQKYRRKSAEKVLEDLKFLAEKYGVNDLLSIDSIMDRSYYDTFIPELIKMGSPYNIYYEVKANLTKNQIKLFRQAGINCIQPGIESLHSKALKLINKGLKAWQAIYLLKWSFYYGISVKWNFLHNIPEDKDSWYEEMAKFVPLLVHFEPPTGIVSVIIERHSFYYDNAEKYGLKLRIPSPYKQFFKLPEETVKQLVFTFSDEGYKEKLEDDMYDLLHMGLLSVKRELVKWKELHKAEKKPLLKMKVSDDRIEIEDTRPCAVRQSFLLCGIDKDVYLACEEGPLIKDIIKISNDEDSIKESIKKMTEWKLLLNIDSRLLSLAIEEPLRPLPEKEDLLFFKKGAYER